MRILYVAQVGVVVFVSTAVVWATSWRRSVEWCIYRGVLILTMLPRHRIHTCKRTYSIWSAQYWFLHHRWGYFCVIVRSSSIPFSCWMLMILAYYLRKLCIFCAMTSIVVSMRMFRVLLTLNSRRCYTWISFMKNIISLVIYWRLCKRWLFDMLLFWVFVLWSATFNWREWIHHALLAE